jgi:hypothetical protein
MHWTVNGAADIIAPRCQHASGRWDELWTARAASLAGLRPAIWQTRPLRHPGQGTGKIISNKADVHPEVLRCDRVSC